MKIKNRLTSAEPEISKKPLQNKISSDSQNFSEVPGETTHRWHHGSENLIQIFLMDSSINLKYRFILAKLSKMETRIFAAY
jgi:hypothetical protein